MTKKELQTILKKHRKWLKSEEGGERARLCSNDLCKADLSKANLCFAPMWAANLHDADLRRADLHYADLNEADLSNSNLDGADLRFAKLYMANLSNADLRGAYLQGADLRGANLSGADLRGANLCSANLCDANLSGANLTNAYFDYANLFKAKMNSEEQYHLGTILKRKMIGYKKLLDGTICKLEIPKGAIVFCINGYKCRTNIAKVLEGEGVSQHDNSFVYKKGKTLKVKDFSLQYNAECASGIHFFRTKKEAKKYIY